MDSLIFVMFLFTHSLIKEFIAYVVDCFYPGAREIVFYLKAKEFKRIFYIGKM